MKVLNLFPLSIVQDKILINQKIKKDMNSEIETMLLNSKNKDFKGPQDSWTGDTQGFEYLYKNQHFELLFKEIKIKLGKYLRHLGINENKIDLYLTRSWATISNGKERIKQHKHQQSHISFAYYLKKDEDDSNIVFFNEDFTYSSGENGFFYYEDKFGGLKLPLPNILGQFTLENIFNDSLSISLLYSLSTFKHFNSEKKRKLLF